MGKSNQHSSSNWIFQTHTTKKEIEITKLTDQLNKTDKDREIYQSHSNKWGQLRAMHFKENPVSINRII